MDSCCVALKANAHVAKTSKGDFMYGDKEFWGERIRGSLNNSIWSNQMTRSLRAERNAIKVKPGVAHAVLTSNNPKESMVCRLNTSISFWIRDLDHSMVFL